MNAEIITIGDELLIGQVVDTNSAWMAEQLNLIGIRVVQITSISDQRKHILTTLKEASSRADIILISGGLGPTRDDITKTTLCEYFNTKPVFNQDAYENIVRLFGSRGFVITPLNCAQAEVPESCTPLLNVNGTAPGMWFEKDGIIYVSMPGVPFEMKGLMTTHVLPRLSKLSSTGIVHRTILTQGVGESFLAAKIEDWETALPDYIKLAYLPQPGIVRLRLTASGPDRTLLEKEINERVTKLYGLIPEYIFGEGDETLEMVVSKLLKAHGFTLATAESCTGGYIAHLITSIPGSSAFFKGSVVAYANEIKEHLLGVTPDTLARYGAVSQETVFEMAAGIIRHLKVDCAVAVSGIAGPDGGTPDKQVGTTWISVLSPKGAETKMFTFGEHRGRNIRRAALAALDMLRKQLSI
ncbi:Nicotinamide-nucleotide amidohydrolase PncC [bioreactor metagenome]|jgi:nicotinamide-nucleotide amidase|uniref:CinA-like protein n=2 Tax=root TaxID=1 RepID=A0A0S7C2C1_9BACT|nr:MULTISPECIES: competence/damage-inducible protein A [Lentimicrobium]MEA5109680.1 competence/damage-inducible protein A [Lentimicrobium sp.]GAP43144.1 amidohydrolase, PncC family [Lentimicrobium saccharophilum]HCT70194.1 competence/damage-inducible protein A [Bacteroidales bacterium]